MKGFFFNSVSNIEKTTSLTKKQQISSILKLEKENLIQVEIVDNNTRYFSLNNDKIDEYKQSNYEEFLKVESGISNTSESGKSNTLEKLVNKFESGKSNTSESGIGYSSERVKGNTTKVEKVIG
jgi:type II secretory ATPase GspE/PulE/Tfp pilus assembly ATPase PilB-like protein